MQYLREDGRTPAVGEVTPLENSPGVFVDSEGVRVYTKAEAAALTRQAKAKQPAVPKSPASKVRPSASPKTKKGKTAHKK